MKKSVAVFIIGLSLVGCQFSEEKTEVLEPVDSEVLASGEISHSPRRT